MNNNNNNNHHHEKVPNRPSKIKCRRQKHEGYNRYHSGRYPSSSLLVRFNHLFQMFDKKLSNKLSNNSVLVLFHHRNVFSMLKQNVTRIELISLSSLSSLIQVNPLTKKMTTTKVVQPMQQQPMNSIRKNRPFLPFLSRFKIIIIKIHQQSNRSLRVKQSLEILS